MPSFYRVLKADPLDGEYTPNQPGAKPLKSYWCQVEGVDEPVMITKQVPNTPSLTEGHYGVLEQRTSSKGNSYFKFTSMQMPQGTSKPRYDAPATAAPAQQTHPSDQTDIPMWFAPFGVMIRELWNDMKARNAEDAIANPAPESPETATEEAKGVGGGSITDEELADIFGGEVQIQDIPSKEA